ncbi:MAG: protoporphyrinogen oxidase [Nitrospirota bacterium]|nr:protoporphyrinogen oxidase [Nitrospirota bacterium]
MPKIVIIGGGLSGLTIAYLIIRSRPDADVTVLEAEGRPGGKIWTERTKGFICEKGPNGFLDNKPKTLELCEALGIEPVRSNQNSKKRFILSGGRLNALPESPVSFIRSDLLSWGGKLRLLRELKAAMGPEDETVAEFITRRLGKEALEKLIDPMCSGIYAGDPYKMSIKSSFPRIKELEQEYGSLIKALLAIRKQRKAVKGAAETVSAAPGGTLTSFRNGAETIISALSERLGRRVELGGPVHAIERDGASYKVYTPKDTITADTVVIATPAYASAGMLRDLDSGISGLLDRIPYPHVNVVCFGIKKEKVTHPLNGFGFLVPNIEKRKILGTLWDTSIFPNRAFEGLVLMRTMVGGAKHPDMAALDDYKLIEIVYDELKPILGFRAEPDMAMVYRWHKAIPQYLYGHSRILHELDERLEKYPNLYLAGNAYRGISINDCVENGYRLAGEILNKMKPLT